MSKLLAAATLLLGMSGAALPAAAAQPYLVKDINDVFVPANSDPEVLATLGSLVLFTANDLYHGREVWRTDGTAGGTYRLLDACAGECSGGGRRIVSAPDGFFFEASGENGLQLWFTNGSVAGTMLLATGFVGIGDGAWSSSSHRALFYATDNAFRGLPWVSDGTPAGTHPLFDPFPGGGQVLAFRGQVLFTSGASLWLSDGSAAGTRPVRLWENDGLRSLRGLLVVGDRVLFVLDTPSSSELWKTDGTLAGTVMVYRFSSPNRIDSNRQAVGNRLYFTVFSYAQGIELWVSDGTPRGTRTLTAFNPTGPFGGSLYLYPLDRQALFFADDGRHGFEPWVTDGTPRGTRMFADLCKTRYCGASPLGVLGKRLLAIPSAADGSRRLWVSDGTAAGTRGLTDLCTGACGNVRPLATLGGRMLILAPQSGIVRLWTTDGTPQGTSVVRSFPGAGDVFVHPPAEAGGSVYFAASEEHDGMELWRTDGTVGGTQEIFDASPGVSAGSNPSSLAAAGSRVFFYANDGEHGSELWTSEGTAETTHLVREDAPGDEPTQPPHPHRSLALGNTLLFVNERDSRVWRSDGTTAGTYPLAPVGVHLQLEGAILGSLVFLPGSDDQNGHTLWATDATAAGTRRVLALGPIADWAGTIAAFGDRVFFWKSTATEGWELWSTDGTTAGTGSISALVPGLGRAVEATPLTPGSDGIYVQMRRPTNAVELWRTDGTQVGTKLVTDDPSFPGTYMLRVGARIFTFGYDLGVTDGTREGSIELFAGIRPRPLLAFADAAYFVANTCALPCVSDDVLWRSDGTPEGTSPVLDADGNALTNPQSLAVFAGHLVFIAGRNDAIWSTDGTPAGTLALQRPDGTTLFGGPLQVAGDRLYFSSSDPVHGSELWALDP